MEFRTKTEIPDPGFNIDYDDSLLFLGSCFAVETGEILKKGKISSMVNPMGVQYNPFSVANGLDLLMSEKRLSPADLHNHKNKYLSFNHDTSFSDRDPARALEKINTALISASDFLRKATVLVVTFGTAWFYRLRETGEIVANCHKIPAVKFTRELASLDEMKATWTDLIEKLYSINTNLRVIFTVSPVRHLKDGAHGNQVSKSLLMILADHLAGLSERNGYFPSYEIMLDELRDYRFYKDDMAHPSPAAIRYIMNRFMQSYFSNQTIKKFEEISSLANALSHRIMSGDEEDRKQFSSAMLKKIGDLSEKYGDIDFSTEINVFNNL